MVSAPEHPQRQLLPMHFLFFLFPYPDGITNTDNVQSMLVQSLYINDVSDKARKVFRIPNKTKFLVFFLKRNKIVRKNVNKSTGNDAVVISLHCSKDQKGAKLLFTCDTASEAQHPPLPTLKWRVSCCSEEQRYTVFIRWEGICQRLIEFHCNIHISQRHTLTGSNYFQQAGPATRTLWTGMALQSVCFRSDR